MRTPAGASGPGARRTCSSDRSRIDSRPVALTGSTKSGDWGLDGVVGTNDASTRRFKKADSVMPWVCARAAKRAFVSRVTQVIRCVLSLIARATVHQLAAARLSCKTWVLTYECCKNCGGGLVVFGFLVAGPLHEDARTGRFETQ